MMRNNSLYANSHNRSGELPFETFSHSVLTDEYSMFNLTQQTEVLEYHPFTALMERYIIPSICLVGLISNTLASVVFLRKTLRNSSCSIFLAARGFSDNGFLLTLLIIWISRTFHLQLGSIEGSCRIIIFLSYICGCVSVWLVVFVTLENYIRICRPFSVNSICTTSVAKSAVGILCLLTVSFYNFPFWAMRPDMCTPYPQFYATVQAFVYTDTAITLLLPLICIIILMTGIVFDFVESYHRRNRLRTRTGNRGSHPMTQVTKMLLAVTISFICLNLPSHVNRIRIMITSLVNDNSVTERNLSLEEAVQQITLLMYYLSLSTNIIVYIIFGSRFRRVLTEIFSIFPLRKLNENSSWAELTPLKEITCNSKTENVETDSS